MGTRKATGPLAGVRVVELTAIGPVPHAAMILADLGADVVRVERPDRDLAAVAADHSLRGRQVVKIDLKDASQRDDLLGLIRSADVVLDGYRPGVTEKLGIGPDVCQAANERLIYARMTGWGQEGPMARRAGHDINYLALTGALHSMGEPGRPPSPPLNLVGDYGGGSMFLLVGILAALASRERSGRGDVLDVAMVDGITSLLQPVWSMRASGAWSDRRGANLSDGAAPFYRVYECAGGGFVAVGAVERPFYENLLAGRELDVAQLPDRARPANWPALSEAIRERFLTRTRDEWAQVFGDTDACVTPVLDFAEAVVHPHLVARGVHITVGGVTQAAAAPRFGSLPEVSVAPPPAEWEPIEHIMQRWDTQDEQDMPRPGS